jgi:hypothetical protein
MDFIPTVGKDGFVDHAEGHFAGKIVKPNKLNNKRGSGTG